MGTKALNLVVHEISRCGAPLAATSSRYWSVVLTKGAITPLVHGSRLA